MINASVTRITRTTVPLAAWWLASDRLTWQVECLVDWDIAWQPGHLTEEWEKNDILILI